MGLITGEFYYEKETWASRIYNIIHPHSDEVALVDNKLRFYDRFSIAFSNANAPVVSLVYDGSLGTTTLCGNMGWWTGSGTCVYTLIIGDNAIYFTGYRKGYPGSGGGTFSLVCLKNEDKYFAGCYGGENAACSNINNITLYNAIAPNLGGHTIRKLFTGITLASTKIAYADKLLFANSSNDAEVNCGLLSSSDITHKSTVTIDGKNYYAVGTNILFLLS